MICPRCNVQMEEMGELSFACETCYDTINLCKICKMPNTTLNSDICGHPSCIEKKMSRMWKPEIERKTRRERSKHV